ncbi:MAG: R3H domain-containing nucleic acid-binding protein [bacterium]
MNPNIQVTDNLEELLGVLPPSLKEVVSEMEGLEDLIEIVFDLGREPEARFPNRGELLSENLITRDDINYVVSKVGSFDGDNRAGIPRTLHRISCIRNRKSEIIGLTLRVGRAIYGTVDIVRDVIESGKSILLLGKPGVGKTTMLREVARILSDELKKRVVVVDTSNEIGGDGDIPHPAIGRARRMQVSSPEKQHDVMIEAVENHMPEVIVIDEIGTELEAKAARTIAERGVQLIGTAHGINLENLLLNPTLSDLVGGLHVVTLSDEEAKKRGTQKTVLERKAPPTFDVVIEIRDRDTLAIHHNVSQVIDSMLRGYTPRPEIRIRKEDGYKVIEEAEEIISIDKDYETSSREKGIFRIYPFGISRNRLEKSIRELDIPALITKRLDEADFILTLTSHEKREGDKLIARAHRDIPIHTVKSNTLIQIKRFLRDYFLGENEEDTEDLEYKKLISEIDEGIKKVMETSSPVELSPKNARIRRLQHEIIERYQFHSDSIGIEPYRRVRILP